MFLPRTLKGSTPLDALISDFLPPGLGERINVWVFFVCLFKSLLNLLQFCFCLMFCFFGHEACGIFSFQTRTEPTPYIGKRPF